MIKQGSPPVSEIETNANDFLEIDLQRLWKAVWKNAWVIALSAFAGLAVAVLITIFLVTPRYQSSVMFYVNNSALSVGDASLSLSTGDISASKSLVDSYIVILKSRGSLNDVIDYAGADITYSQLSDMISAQSVNATEIFEVVVTSADPKQAEELANAIAYILPKRISSIIEGSSAEVVDYAIVATEPSSPSLTTNSFIGVSLGLFISVMVIVLREMLDVTIRSEADVEQCCSYPILAAVPDMNAPSKGGYYNKGYGYAYGDQKRKSITGQAVLTGEGVDFAAREAYKLLRTKLQFSFSDGNRCHIIGVSSAMAGEGKSLTSVNLSYAFAQLNKRVVLIDCDMRRPSVDVKLNIEKVPGLSNYLAGHIDWKDGVQTVKLEDSVSWFDVVSAGRNPPNPIEMLGSERMSKALDSLRNEYDYIILDLPPVGEVSDAMVAATLADGILLVGRQNYCNRLALTEATRQFEFVGTKILGVVLNCATDHSGGYGKKYKYGRYESKDDRAYYNAHTAAAKQRFDKDAPGDGR